MKQAWALFQDGGNAYQAPWDQVWGCGTNGCTSKSEWLGTHVDAGPGDEVGGSGVMSREQVGGRVLNPRPWLVGA